MPINIHHHDCYTYLSDMVNYLLYNNGLNNAKEKENVSWQKHDHFYSWIIPHYYGFQYDVRKGDDDNDGKNNTCDISSSIGQNRFHMFGNFKSALPSQAMKLPVSQP